MPKNAADERRAKLRAILRQWRVEPAPLAEVEAKIDALYAKRSSAAKRPSK